MDKELREQFFTALMRIRKLEAAFAAASEMQMTELTILRSITGSCGCELRPGVNLNVPDIQSRLQISKPAVSYILNTLERKSYIIREIDARDRRKISVSPTREGLAVSESSDKKVNDLWERLLQEFGEQEMEQLISMVFRLSEVCGRIDEEK